MSVTQQLNNDSSQLNVFLNQHLPQRHEIIDDWRTQLKTKSPVITTMSRTAATHVGDAFELRMGLDLASEPTGLNLLGYLPPAYCHDVLLGAGFVVNPPASYESDSGTLEPLELDWHKHQNPIELDDDQLASLRSCLAVVAMGSIGQRKPLLNADARRRTFQHVYEYVALDEDDGAQAEQGIAQLWQTYMSEGREQVESFGWRKIVSPEIALGYAYGDFIIGRTLLEVKTHAQPDRWLQKTFDQALSYALLDRLDVYELDTIAVYLGWHATTLAADTSAIASTSTPGLTPAFDDLRQELSGVLKDDLDGAEKWQRRQFIAPAL